jgi:hypothetical protein
MRRAFMKMLDDSRVDRFLHKIAQKWVYWQIHAESDEKTTTYTLNCGNENCKFITHDFRMIYRHNELLKYLSTFPHLQITDNNILVKLPPLPVPHNLFIMRAKCNMFFNGLPCHTHVLADKTNFNILKLNGDKFHSGDSKKLTELFIEFMYSDNISNISEPHKLYDMAEKFEYIDLQSYCLHEMLARGDYAKLNTIDY